ncbi:MAG: LarC family nickel insertion protein [Firmicutes bacterium]|nr:LarC family nickel insertion protein [Bacillota bacterium]
MASVLYWDPFSGISGDMAVGALLALGADWNAIREAIDALAIDTLTVDHGVVSRGAVEAARFQVSWTPSDPPVHRHLAEILEIVQRAELPPRIQRRMETTFRVLAEAEARIHGQSPDAVHLHEVGAEDSIADIVATMVALDSLHVEHCVVGPIATGWGWTQGAHGPLPVPAPATLELLKGFIVTSGYEAVELTTPTGAALLHGIGAVSQMAMPRGRLRAVGYGAGRRDLSHPNVLRAVLLDVDAEGEGVYGGNGAA